MEKKLLLAIDGSKNSLMALDYVQQLFQMCPEIILVLFHALPPTPPVYQDSSPLDPVSQKYLRQLKERHQKAIEEILIKTKKDLLKKGWSESQIKILSREQRGGLAREILFEAKKEMVDAVIIGRRGLGKIEEMYLGSVSNQVIQGAKDIPIWIVGGKVKPSRILVAVDGSENSLRSVDHLSFILGACRQEEMQILLLHVWPGLINLSGLMIVPDLSSLSYSEKKYEKAITPYLDQCEEILREAGISPGRIQRKICLKCSDIGKAILSEADEGHYGTIVVGRRGISKAKEFFLGSVSNKIVQQAGNKAVWIVG
ncbi:MAG: universal stress protein [Deltaproteobacteria bacterium]|nr:universal stress protein [Deltaproteobacteria bacterium]